MSASVRPSAPATIGVEELRARLEEGEPTFVLDVRPAAERAEWAIPGSAHIDAYRALGIPFSIRVVAAMTLVSGLIVAATYVEER